MSAPEAMNDREERTVREATCQQGEPCGDTDNCPDPIGCGFVDDQPERTLEPVMQIVVEMVRETNGGIGWSWDAFGEERRLCGGSASSLSACLDSMRAYLREDGTAP